MNIYRFLTGLAIIALSISACSSPTTVPSTPTSNPVVPPAPTSTLTLAAPDPTSSPVAEPEPTTTEPQALPPNSAPISCTAPASLTPTLTEGPYYTANAPERVSLLEPGMPGTVLNLTGYVLTADCQPIAGALLDFWQANSQGVYDNAGYTLRGRQYTDANGRYQLETVVPGLYPGRTEHIHVKVQAPGGPVLTTQLFFPDVTDNAADRIYDRALLILIQDSASILQGTFNFIVETP